MPKVKSGKRLSGRGVVSRRHKATGAARAATATAQVRTFDHDRPGASLGAPFDSALQAADIVIAGLPARAVMRLHQTSGLTIQRIKQLAGISEGTFARRKRSGKLSPAESERLLRLALTFERAASLYDGDTAGARQWLETPLPSLGDRRPLDLARTEPGAREVEDLIGRIAHGIVS